jgi:hypothetical protein
MQGTKAAPAASPGARPAGAFAAAAPGQHTGTLAQFDEQKRRRGAEIGNRRAWRHGRRSRTAEMRRRETAAVLKLARHLLVAADAMPSRCRPRRLRPDQLALLGTLDPDGLQIARAAGVDLPGTAPSP